jgi:hypothetical protein
MQLLGARRNQIPVDNLPRDKDLLFPVCDPFEPFLGFANPSTFIAAE